MKCQIENGEVEIRLASASPELVEQMKQVRKVVEDSLAGEEQEFAGLARNSEGDWVGVFRQKS